MCISVGRTEPNLRDFHHFNALIVATTPRAPAPTPANATQATFDIFQECECASKRSYRHNACSLVPMAQTILEDEGLGMRLLHDLRACPAWARDLMYTVIYGTRIRYGTVVR